ncbi:hypothetical protein C8R43DRAFT_1040414 [Mycena crocata]|nr:hypothetical protein C8R43DRAFT_1040414 [Mycena crocata]
MDTRSLPPTTDDILSQCPRFRILVVGKSGAGKSSLINHAFGVELAKISHQEQGAGVSDINTEITAKGNSRFVLHDSQGFEPGQMANFETAKKFLESRGAGVDLKDRVHASWLCIQVPFAGGRVFETGDELFLKLASESSVPVVVVFTKFDLLVSRKEEYLTDEEMETCDSEEDINRLCLKKADDEFDEACLGPLQRINRTLSFARTSGLVGDFQTADLDRQALANLIQITQNLVERDVQGTVWIVAAMAQRANARKKIDASIQVGMKQYWQSLASSGKFLGFTLGSCLATIHLDITQGWNFNDPHELLEGQEFQNKVKTLAQLVVPDDSKVESWFTNLEHIETLIGVGSSIIAAAAPAVAVIGLSAMFVNWIAGVYRKSPEVLRFFMGYIVDLTLVLDQLFLALLPLRLPRIVTADHLEMALENYKNGDAAKVHREIRKYANEATFTQICQSNKAQDKVIELIERYCAK